MLTIGPNSAVLRHAYTFTRNVCAMPRSQFVKGDEPACRFIPEYQRHAGNALTECESANLLKFGVKTKCHRQPIKRNSATEMAYAVYADVASEPA